LERSLHFFAFEGGEGEDGSSANGRFVAAGVEDRRESGRVREGAEGGDGGFAGEGIVVVGCDGDQSLGCTGTGDRAELAQRPGRGFGNRDVIVGQSPDQSPRRTGAEPGRELGGAATHRGIGVVDRSSPRGSSSFFSRCSHERRERRCPDARVGIGAGPLIEHWSRAPGETALQPECSGVRGPFDG
jgi:hypothetical protein